MNQMVNYEKKLDLKKVIYATPDPGVRPEPTAEPTQEPTPEPIEPTIVPTPEASDFGW